VDYNKLAELLFPDVTVTPEELEAKYPARDLKEGARVTRFAPSPTGFLHIGGLFAAFVAKLTAVSTDGVFFLRIEDTDKKREIEDGVSAIVNGLTEFGVDPMEGVMGMDKEEGTRHTQAHLQKYYSAIEKNENLPFVHFLLHG